MILFIYADKNANLLNIGLWETCTNFPPVTSWECRTNSNTTIPYKGMTNFLK